jgi:hypothetical protein
MRRRNPRRRKRTGPSEALCGAGQRVCRCPTRLLSCPRFAARSDWLQHLEVHAGHQVLDLLTVAAHVRGDLTEPPTSTQWDGTPTSPSCYETVHPSPRTVNWLATATSA